LAVSDELIRALKQLRKCKFEFEHQKNGCSEFSFTIELAVIIGFDWQVFNFGLFWQTPIAVCGST